MKEKALILQRSIERDLASIEEIYGRLTTSPMALADDPSALIVTGYYLHNLYAAFENSFLQIGRTFENQLTDQSGWHSELLQRMRLDLRPIRPAVIDDVAFALLDEMRRFRHVFRHAYEIELDPQRLELVWQRALALKGIYPGQIGRFIAFLEQLQV
jgi:hypothetical protein